MNEFKCSICGKQHSDLTPSWLRNKILFDLDLIPWILIADQ